MEKNKRPSLVAVPYGMRERPPRSYPPTKCQSFHACSRKPCESQVELAMGISWRDTHHLLSEESP